MTSDQSSRLRRLLNWASDRMPWIAFVGVVLSAALFAFSLPAHADRGSWGDLLTVGAYNWWPVVLLLLVGFFARGRTTLHVAAGWFSGYFLSMAVVFLILDPTGNWLGDDSRWQSAFLVPVVEEAAKALPLLLLYFTIRRTRWMKPTVTDFTVYGLAVGGGFAFHEDALFARVISEGWDGWGLLFPAIVQDPVFAVGHGVWTGLVGLGIGIALAKRGRSLVWLIPLAAYLLVTIDHALVNDGGSRSLLLDGRLPLYLLTVGIVAALAIEMKVVTSAAGGTAEFRAGVSSGLRVVRNAGGIRATLLYWKRFVATLRVMIQQVWSRHTQMAVVPAISPEPTMAADSSPIESAPTAMPTGGQPDDDDSSATAWLVGGALVIAALIFWFVGVDHSKTDEEASSNQTSSDQSETTASSGSGSGSDSENSSFNFGDGPIITTPLLLRWEQSSDLGDQDDLILAIDGDRELRTEGSLLQYRDGDLGVQCFEIGTDSVTCFGAEASGTLAAGFSAGDLEVSDLPGTTGETRTIAGREAFCVFTPISEDESVLSCGDTETGIMLLGEVEGKTLTGQETFARRELVQWSTPEESDFELIPEALAALSELESQSE